MTDSERLDGIKRTLILSPDEPIDAEAARLLVREIEKLQAMSEALWTPIKFCPDSVEVELAERVTFGKKIGEYRRRFGKMIHGRLYSYSDEPGSEGTPLEEAIAQEWMWRWPSKLPQVTKDEREKWTRDYGDRIGMTHDRSRS